MSAPPTCARHTFVPLCDGNSSPSATALHCHVRERRSAQALDPSRVLKRFRLRSPRLPRLRRQALELEFGDETAEPGLDRVWDSQERQSAGDGVEWAGFGLGDAKSERGENFGLRFAEAWKHASDLVGPVAQWFRLARGRLLLCGFCYSPQRWSFFARESTFSYTPPEKCKAVSIKGEGIRWLEFWLGFG